MIIFLTSCVVVKYELKLNLKNSADLFYINLISRLHIIRFLIFRLKDLCNELYGWRLYVADLNMWLFCTSV